MFGNKNITLSKETIENIYSAKEMLVGCQDDYNIGMYNGMEYALAAIEGRKPDYFVPVSELKEAERKKEEIKQRTVASGIKRR